MINESVEVRSLKVYVTPQFVQEFLDLFDSEESVERDYLKNILHKLYAKVRNRNTLNLINHHHYVATWCLRVSHFSCLKCLIVAKGSIFKSKSNPFILAITNLL